MQLSDPDLEALLDDHESDRAERKESFKGSAPEKVREAVCAFANDLPHHRRPGVVFIGVKDNGTPVPGHQVTDELLRNLADIRSDGNIQPIPTMVVEKRVLRGAELAVIVVAPSDAPPVRYKGRTYIRTGPRRDLASQQDERILAERRRSRDLPFDLQPIPSFSIADLHRRTFDEEYLPGAFSADVLAANHRSYEERLAACRMISSIADPSPTVLGALVLGVDPRALLPCAYLQFLRFEGIDLASNIIDEAVIDGRLGDVIAQLDNKMKANISARVDVHSADKEQRFPDYPLAALQQLTRNAIMHRTYEATNAPVKLHWFSDRIEILSPGGPFGVVTQENFGQPGVTDYRNPHVAEALKALGYVQRFGVGIETARAQLAKNGNPPLELLAQPSHVLATVRRAHAGV